MEHKIYTPSGVCSKKIEFDYENGKIYNVSFLGGCPGNLRAISKLVNGMELTKVVELLEGNICRGNTSCADQLVKAIKEVI